MARRIPEDRFDQLVDAACEVFIARGYRQTQMSDVASAVGVAKGTIYGYVESKEALFILCLLHADRRVPLEHPASLPFKSPRKGELASLMKQRLGDQTIPRSLSTALECEHVEDPRAELESIVREFYQTLERFCRVIKLIDRCVDHPELQSVWQTQGREPVRAALARYLDMRMRGGQLRSVSNPRLAARMIVEVATTWAVHIKWDRSPENFDSLEARENAIDFLVQALVV